jgi:DNA-binding LacI/PurR family transcriptional regulator
LVEAVRGAITTGVYAPGQFVPSARELSGVHGVSAETVRRGLKLLEREGLLIAEPRQGFRVAVRPEGLKENVPIAYVTRHSPDLRNAQAANLAISSCLQQACSSRGWSTLGAHSGGGDAAEVVGKLRAARAWGVVLDSLDEELVDGVRGAGFPVVMVNSWVEDCDVDVVLQDNYRGGFQAAQHLVETGCERIAWLGPVGGDCHSRERYAGAVAGMRAAGRRLEADRVAETADGKALAAARDLLRGDDRPDGVIVLWKGVAKALKAAAHEMGLFVGRDLQAVGWTTEEFYDLEHRAVFAGGRIPAAVTWKAAGMAEAALDRLDEIRRNGRGEPRRILVPTRLRTNGGEA